MVLEMVRDAYFGWDIVMGLVYRRILASFINSIILLIIVILLCFLIGATLWFFPFRSYLNLNWFFVIFAVFYSTLGNLGKGGLPPIGGKIAGIRLSNVVNAPIKYFQILFRNILYVLAPVTILMAFKLMPNIYNIKNTGVYFGILTVSFVVMFFSILLIPISILVGRGQKGLHDAVCKLTVSRKESNVQSNLTTKHIFSRSLLWAFLGSLLLTFAAHAAIFGVGFQPFLYPGTNRDTQTTEIENFSNELDSIFSITPIKYRHIDTQEGFKWWVDLYLDIPERLKVNEAIGLKGLNRLDVLGYGIKISKLFYPIELVDMDRESSKVIPAGTNVFSLFIFVDSGAFSQGEIRRVINEYFQKKIAAINVAQSSDVWQIKIIRQVKVGVVTLGFFDEIYITKDGGFWGEKYQWRDKSSINLPVISNIHTRSIFIGTFITSIDLQ